MYAKKRYGQAFEDKEEEEFLSIAEDDIKELGEEFDELEKSGVLNSPCDRLFDSSFGKT